MDDDTKGAGKLNFHNDTSEASGDEATSPLRDNQHRRASVDSPRISRQLSLDSQEMDQEGAEGVMSHEETEPSQQGAEDLPRAGKVQSITCLTSMFADHTYSL